MNRKSFIKTGIVGSLALSIPSILLASKRKDIFDLEEIKALVYVAHSDLKETQKIIEAKPLLLNCANQNKKGDFETSMGAASHVGRREIADYLISKGARLDIFNYTFLGYDDFVMKFITDYPAMLNAPGPHGFTLLHHAEVGDRTELAEWLKEKGLTETFFKGVFG